MPAAVVSCASMVIITNLRDVQPDVFLHYIDRGSIHDHRLRLLPIDYCALPIILKIFSNLNIKP